MSKLVWMVVSLLLLAACSASQTHLGNDSDDVEIVSSLSMDVDLLNARIERAIVAGENWPSSPMLIVFYLVGGDSETQIMQVSQRAQYAELPKTIVVTALRDGFLDDSVRGDWHQITFDRLPDDTWRVTQARRAMRCRRPDTGVYQSDPCL